MFSSSGQVQNCFSFKKQNNSLSTGRASSLARDDHKGTPKLLVQEEGLVCLVWDAVPERSLQTHGFGLGRWLSG